MKTINIPKSKFESLPKLKLDQKITNTEGTIYDFEYIKNHPGILKKLYATEGYAFANKLYTLEMLDYYKDILPNSFVVPDNLVSVRGKVVGFTCQKINGYNLSTILSDKKIDKDDKIYYLKSIGDILEKMDNIRKYSELKDLFLADLHECNFMVKPYSRDLFVVDLDSCKIANNLANPARYLTPFSLLNNADHKYKINNNPSIPAHVIPDANSDLYCYNIMILNFLAGTNINNFSLEEFYDYLNYLEFIGIDKNLLDSFNNIVGYGPNINIREYLDSLTSENIVRSKNNVYKKVKGKI